MIYTFIMLSQMKFQHWKPLGDDGNPTLRVNISVQAITSSSWNDKR